MTDRAALMAAIRESPEEDTPRLAYADLIEEQGHDQRNQYFLDWAELIRNQIEFARVERFTPRWLELARRQAELFTTRKKDWPPLWGGRLGYAAYRRGMREGHLFEYNGRSFLSTFDLAMRASPIRAVQFPRLNTSDPETVTELTERDGFRWVETLDLGNNRPRLARKFLKKVRPRMTRLRALGLAGQVLSSSAAADLLATLVIPNLTALDLSQNPLFSGSPEECRPESLLRSPALAKLEWLDLHHVTLTPHALHTLANSPVLHNLRYLDLSNSGYHNGQSLDAEGAELLASGGGPRRLEVLSLARQRIGSAGLQTLTSPILSTVRELNLEGNEIGDEGVIALAACPYARSLRKLDLSNSGMGEAGAEAILTSPHLTELRILIWNLPHPNALSDPGGGVWARLQERFAEQVPVISSVHSSLFFEPIP